MGSTRVVHYPAKKNLGLCQRQRFDLDPGTPVNTKSRRLASLHCRVAARSTRGKED